MNKTRAGRRDATETSGQVMMDLLQAAHVLEDRLERSLGDVGLSSAKLAVLGALVSSAESLPLSELAGRLRCVRSNITQLVDRLEADGLVRREDDPQDRRSVRAAITPQGRERQAAGAARLEAFQREVAARLSGADGATLARALAALRG